MSKLTNRHNDWRTPRYVAWLFEVSVILTVIPLVVHALVAVNSVPIV